MIAGLTRNRIPDVALFVAFNIAAVMLVVVLVVAPVLTHFSERSEDIAESSAQLRRFETILHQAKADSARTSGTGDPYYPAGEERVVSADIQASLKSLAQNAGVNLLAIRGLPAGRIQQMHLVAVGIEVEGPLASIRDMMRAIESQTPMLLLSSATLRSVTDGDDGAIRAQLTVQGAMRDGPRAGEEANSQ